MIKKGGHSHSSSYVFVSIVVVVINGYIFGLEYIKQEETKTKGIIMLTASIIASISIILFIAFFLYYDVFIKFTK